MRALLGSLVIQKITVLFLYEPLYPRWPTHQHAEGYGMPRSIILVSIVADEVASGKTKLRSSNFCFPQDQHHRRKPGHQEKLAFQISCRVQRWTSKNEDDPNHLGLIANFS